MVALSGGVDSAVAALLLQERGHAVQALFMHNWNDDQAYCTAAQDYQDARRIADHLRIPLHKIDFTRQYRDEVFADFLRRYRAGQTPNPDVLCNRHIKFGVCLEYARRLGATRFATGHYARIEQRDGRFRLCKGRDRGKDQSYFLHAVDPNVLGRVLFPLGDLTKDEVRRRAHEAGLAVFDKPDSTGICFIGERPFQAFLSQYLPPRPGPIETPAGEPLGAHQGLMYYTLGQRQGLHIGGRRGAGDAPWYVAGKDHARNALIAVQGHDHPLLFSNGLTTEPVHWLVTPATQRFDCAVKTRYRQPDQACTVALEAGRAQVRFAQPQRAVTPGQYAVFYDGEVCLGGAAIERTQL
jgi:tRNA-specific 2-thiouridylase